MNGGSLFEFVRLAANEDGNRPAVVRRAKALTFLVLVSRFSIPKPQRLFRDIGDRIDLEERVRR
jgi:hypothetical protein